MAIPLYLKDKDPNPQQPFISLFERIQRHIQEIEPQSRVLEPNGTPFVSTIDLSAVHPPCVNFHLYTGHFSSVEEIFVTPKNPDSHDVHQFTAAAPWLLRNSMATVSDKDRVQSTIKVKTTYNGIAYPPRINQFSFFPDRQIVAARITSDRVQINYVGISGNHADWFNVENDRLIPDSIVGDFTTKFRRVSFSNLLVVAGAGDPVSLTPELYPEDFDDK